MNRTTRCIALPLTLAVMAGCAPTEAPAPTEKGPAAKKKVHLEGEIHANDERLRVAPFVMHEPGLDLRVQCLSRRDAMAEKGEAIPLCFNETKRPVKTTVKAVRVEHREGMRIAEALEPLRAEHGAAHFVIDDGGTPYQLLDLALPARRGGEYRPEEVRVLSGKKAGHERLLAALKTHFPGWTVTVVEAAPPAPKAPAQKAPQPATPQAP